MGDAAGFEWMVPWSTSSKASRQKIQTETPPICNSKPMVFSTAHTRLINRISTRLFRTFPQPIHSLANRLFHAPP